MDTADPQRGHPRGGLIEQRRAGIKHRRASAASAGLRYVTDDQGGITRKRVGSGWAYYLPDGRHLPFFIAGTLKITYDLLLYRAFVSVRPPEEMQR